MDLLDSDLMVTALPDLDLADPQLDLPSWLFQEDLYQQDFCNGAKDTHFLSQDLAGYSSPPFGTSRDLPDWPETRNINWSQVLGSDELFLKDIKLHQINSPVDQSRQLSPVIDHNIIDDHKFNVQQQTRILTQNNDVNELFFQEPQYLSSPNSVTDHFIQPVELVNCEQEQVFSVNKLVDVKPTLPFVVKVPLADAVERKPVRRIKIASIQRLDRDPSTGFPSHIAHVHEPSIISSSCILSQPKQPQKVVINLRRVSLHPKSVTKCPKIEVVSPKCSGQTLKELLSSGADSDDMIRDLMCPVEDSVNMSETGHGGEASTLQRDMECIFPEDFPPFSPACSTGSPEPSLSSADDCYSSDDEVPSSSSSASSGRYTPYSREEKKLRKKEQNKRAAIRYRQKKKDEDGSLMSILRREEEKQKMLQKKYESVQMEVNLMKKLMREMLAAKRK